MNRRQAKKLIPKKTMYCYKLLERVGRTFKTKYCPHFRYLRTIDDVMEIAGFRRYVKRPVYICTFTGINTEEDFCLYDDCKVCGVI